MSTDAKTCSRPGCEKKLRSTNTTGVCATGCRSPEAPPSSRKVGTHAGTRAGSTTRPKAKAGAMECFRSVAEGLGYSADELLEEFASTWLAALREKVDEAA
jgi:hypothetical protein